MMLICRPNFGGTCETFAASDSNFGNNPIRHDRVSSMKVFIGPPPVCTPAANEVALYEHANFASGQCVNVGMGNFATPEAMRFPNDVLSSARLGSGVQLVACIDAQYLRDCELFTGSVADFGQTRVGNDRVSSIKVQPSGFVDCAPQPTQASFYVHGQMVGPCVALDRRDYPTAAAIGLPNDSISSLRVGAQAQVCACIDNEFKNLCEAFTADDRDLKDNLSGKGNDSISSVRVQARGAQCSTSGPTPVGFREVEVTNCSAVQHDMTVWVMDVSNVSQPGSWKRLGFVQSQWRGGSCPATGLPLREPLPADATVVEIAAVDAEDPGCNEFTAPPRCVRKYFGQFRVNRSGGTARLTID